MPCSAAQTPLRRREPALPPPSGPCQPPQEPRLNIRTHPGSSTLGLGPLHGGIAPDLNTGEDVPPSNFLAVVERWIPLTSLPTSQQHHASIRAAQTPGGPLLRPRRRASSLRRRDHRRTSALTPCAATSSNLEHGEHHPGPLIHLRRLLPPLARPRRPSAAGPLLRRRAAPLPTVAIPVQARPCPTFASGGSLMPRRRSP